MTGVAGRPRLGFTVAELIRAIDTFLGWSNATDAVLCGAASLAVLSHQLATAAATPERSS